MFKVPSRINSTWGGNLVDMVRGTRIIEVMNEERLIEHGARQGERLLHGLQEIHRDFPGYTSNPRGKGLFCALDLASPELRTAAVSRAHELGMIILSTAVAGGPFIGLLGTVWGVMETFSGIARAASASLTAMAPGVAGALIATVTGLLVAIPAMFAYNFMVTTIRHITQELDGFASRYANQIEHVYVDRRDIEDKIAGALKRAGQKDENTPAAAMVEE